MSFATSLNFTSANEDGETEISALGLSQSMRVLCLTASGARPLDLLIGDPGEIVALDNNPAQTHLLALKIAAYRVLDDDELYGFLGVSDISNRSLLIVRVLQSLEGEAREYWENRRPLLASGVWHSGRWERVLRFGALGNRFLRGRHIDTLFAAPTTSTQAEIWARHFDDGLWHASIRLLGQRWIWTKLVGEPGGHYLPEGERLVAQLAGRFTAASKRFLFRDSDFATLIFKGRHQATGALPVHLRRENLKTIRARLGRIQLRTGDLRTLSARAHGHFNAFSLSDFSSYCDTSAYADCWRGVLAVSAPSAFFCERRFLNPLATPDFAADRVSIDEAASDRLTTTDRAIIYDIRAGVCHGTGTG